MTGEQSVAGTTDAAVPEVRFVAVPIELDYATSASHTSLRAAECFFDPWSDR